MAALVLTAAHVAHAQEAERRQPLLWNRGGEESELYLTPGLVWRPSGTWEVGVGAPIGLTRDADGLRGIVKLTYEF